MLAGGFGEVGDELPVEGVAAGVEGGIVAVCLVEHGADGLVVALPEGAQVLAHELDGVLLCVADEDVAGDGVRGDLAHVEDDGHLRHEAVEGDGAVHDVGGGERAVGGELPVRVDGDGAEGVLVARGDEVQVAPVDAEVVAGAVEDALVAGADGEDVGGFRLVAGEEDLLAVEAGGDVRVCAEVDADVVGAAVERVGGPGDVGDGAAEEVEVVEEGRGEEGQVELDGAVAEAIAGVGRGEGGGELLERGDVAGVAAHDAEGLAVDADETGELLGMAGPVAGGGLGQLVRLRPDAEVGVVRDEGHGGWALACLGEERRGGHGEGRQGCGRTEQRGAGGAGTGHVVVSWWCAFTSLRCSA